MNKLFLAILVFVSITSYSQTANPKYDKGLAEKLGGDEYGMKMYVMAILKTGTNKTDNKKIIDSLFSGHMANITRLVESGKLVIAGPFKKNEKNYRGIFILNVKTIAEAQELLATDPAINEKLLEAELFEWYGSAAIPEYLKSHEKIEQKKP